jgi:hypothetical protein
MSDQESSLSQAQRHVLENEQRVARQRAIIVEMDRDKHPQVAAQARRVLETMERSGFLASISMRSRGANDRHRDDAGRD